jgi:hypothetical protein
MKKIFLFFTFFVIQNSFSSEIYKINLAKNEKLEGTFSIVTNKTESVHFLFIKNTSTNKFELRPYFFSANKTIKQLETFSLDEMPEIIANHTNDNIITLISYVEKSKKLFIIDFDIISSKNYFSVKSDYKKPKINFSQTNQSVLVRTIDSEKEIAIETISNSKKSDIINFKPTESFFKEFKNVSKNDPQAINQNEFVENGSIHTDRVYLSQNKVYFTHFKDDEKTQVFKLNLTDNSSSFSDFNFNFPKNSKDQNSYIFDDNLLAVSCSKEDVIINKYDLNTDKLSSELSLSKDLETVLDKNAVEKFLFEAKKGNLKTTAVVNKTRNSKLKIRLGIVNKSTYNYYYNWWWHHNFMMQQMQMQQMRQMQQSVPRGFGPNNSIDEGELIFEKEKKYPQIEFLVDLDFKPQIDSNEVTEYKYFDKDALLKEFEENKTIKKFSSAFLDTEIRYIHQDSKTKTITINFKTIE